jgi:hypothetical protein
MTSRLALSIAPILMFALTHQAQAHGEWHKPSHGTHQQLFRLGSARQSRPRIALLGHRHNRHISFRHLAVRHVAPSTDSYGVAQTDGWNAAVAGISAPPAGTPIGASVRLTSFDVPVASAAIPMETQSSSGQIFNEHAMTAAHATLPFGTKVLVKLDGTDRSVMVTITDRLCERHRIIDLSRGAAEQLGIIHEGLAMVMLTPEN